VQDAERQHVARCGKTWQSVVGCFRVMRIQPDSANPPYCKHCPFRVCARLTLAVYAEFMPICLCRLT